jgi:hypothetical protein
MYVRVYVRVCVCVCVRASARWCLFYLFFVELANLLARVLYKPTGCAARSTHGRGRWRGGEGPGDPHEEPRRGVPWNRGHCSFGFAKCRSAGT